MVSGTYKSVTALLLLRFSAQAVDVLFEDFEDATVTYTTSIAEFTDANFDFFTRTNGSNINSGAYQVSGKDGEFFFAAMDINGEGATLPVTMNFDGLDISGLTNLEFSGLFAEDGDGANQDWDDSDLVHVDYQVDGGGYKNLLHFESTSTGFNAVPAVDTDFDGVGDGTQLTDTFVEFTASIPETGTTLDLRITFDLDAGDEDIAMDNIRITGDGVSGTRFSIFDVAQEEATGTFTFQVTRTGDSSGINTVDYTTVDGTAEGGIDFVSASGTLTFAAGEITQTISITVFDDALEESDKTFSVELSNPSGGASLGTSSAVGTILDDDLLVRNNSPYPFCGQTILRFRQSMSRSNYFLCLMCRLLSFQRFKVMDRPRLCWVRP